MKIYLHRNGKNYGPYSLSVIRDFLKSGKCQENELVCCDGKNWIKLRELPGLAESPSITESKEVRAKMPESEARPKPAKRRLYISATSFLCVLAVVSAAFRVRKTRSRFIRKMPAKDRPPGRRAKEGF